MSWRALVDAPPAKSASRQRTFGHLAATRQWVEQVRAEVAAAGAYAAPEVETVEALCVRWLGSRRDVRVTREGYRKRSPGPPPDWEGDGRALTVRDVEERWRGCQRGRQAPPVARSVWDWSPSTRRSTWPCMTVRCPATHAPRHRKVVKKDRQHWPPGELLAFRQHADTDELVGRGP